MTITPPTQSEFLDIIFSEDPQFVAAALTRQGIKVSFQPDGTLIMDNDFLPLRVGLHWGRTDYSTRRTQVGFILFGIPSWLSKRYPTLDQEINKRWKAGREAKA